MFDTLAPYFSRLVILESYRCWLNDFKKTETTSVGFWVYTTTESGAKGGTQPKADLQKLSIQTNAYTSWHNYFKVYF